MPLAVKPASTPKTTKQKSSFLNCGFTGKEEQLFLNRELGWLAFNDRVLSEAAEPGNPLLERVRFLAIASTNLDAFFMKRIGGLKQQICANVRDLSVDGRSPWQQFSECLGHIASFEAQRGVVWHELISQLSKSGISILRYASLAPQSQKSLRQLFCETIYPLLTPQSLDPAHPFPFISNLSLNILVTLRYPERAELSLARVKVPVAPATPRLVHIKANKFVLLEDLICGNLDLLFPGMEVVDCLFFRVIRNANNVKDQEEAEDLLAMIETELKERRFAPIVRLEIFPGSNPALRGRLVTELEIDEQTDVFVTSEMLGMSDLKELLRLEIPSALYQPHHPVDHPLLPQSQNIFDCIRNSGSILLQHPYESFSTSVERFLKEAASDPKVRAIKMTLYRTTRGSSIIAALLQAAENGKQVAVVVELQARFDEAENIRLSETMNDAGIHVSYGIVGHKTYCKAILVVRQDHDGLRRYVHLGTGNYHPDNARSYCDIGLLSSDEALGCDVTELFNFLTTGLNPQRIYQKLLVGPKYLKKAILKKIEREIGVHSKAGGGLLRFKMNALEDPDIVRALYAASAAGVKVELIIRDSCRIRPGVKGLSDNITVVSLIGRFVEHSRVFYFRNGGNGEYFIGSADAMKRNLENRVEILCPIEPAELQNELQALFDICLAGTESIWDMQPDGTHVKRISAPGTSPVGTHSLMVALAEKRAGSKGKKKKFRLQSVPAVK